MSGRSALGRGAVLAFALAAYAAFVVSYLALINFMGGFPLPLRVDGDAPPTPAAIAVDLALVALFGAQHSVMARAGAKRAWSALPAPVERSAYVLVSAAALLALMALWRPFGPALWDLEASAWRWPVLLVFWASWALTAPASWALGHFELFGVSAAWRYARGEPVPAAGPLRTGGVYGLVRHPLLTLFLGAAWSVPYMTASHALFSGAMTLYVVLGMRLEERDLVRAHPAYTDYMRRVPALWPVIRRRSGTSRTRRDSVPGTSSGTTDG